MTMMTLSRMQSTMMARNYTNSMLSTLLLATLILPALSLAALSGKTAVIVGAGPSGLATALVLAKRHGYQVTILESQKRTDVYDPTKAYPFLIRERGQKLTKLFPDVQADLESKGIETAKSATIISIPADPNEAFDPTPKTIPTFVTPCSDYWLRRHEFIRVLLDAVSREANIQVITGVQCESIQPVSESLVQVVTTLTDTKETKSYSASLVVAADGMKSQVRESLHRSPSLFPSWNNNDPHGFRIRKWMSPASGLQFKTLHLNADAGVPMGNGTMYQIPFDTPVFHSIRSVFTKPHNAISLGLLPAKPAPTRTFNVIRVPSHDIWKIRDGQELRAWFQKAFPRFDFSAESSLVDQAEFDRFAETEGLKLPPCQYCPELYISSPTQEAGVVLVGDAVHTFPPDLGQGVNSGLEDVVVLDECLKKHDKVGEAIAEYASMRGPEVRKADRS
jgi:kynurenine 3-monooxygenase